MGVDVIGYTGGSGANAQSREYQELWVWCGRSAVGTLPSGSQVHQGLLTCFTQATELRVQFSEEEHLDCNNFDDCFIGAVL